MNAIHPNWPAPSNIHCFTTTKLTGENPLTRLDLPSPLTRLKQVHGNTVIILPNSETTPTADGSYTDQPNTPCLIRTADCLPILITNQQGTEVAALHGGWRGLAAGIIESGLAQFTSPPSDLLIWLGPAIGPAKFEVGPEVREAFTQSHPEDQKGVAPHPANPNKWLMDIYTLARLGLGRLGVEPKKIYGGDHCTFTEKDLFYSYRRDKTQERMVSLIWMT